MSDFKASEFHADNTTAERIVYLLSIDELWAKDLGEQLNYFNYAVQLFTDFTKLEKAMLHQPPVALLIDLPMLTEPLFNWLSDIKKTKAHSTLPLIYFSEEGEISLHLKAVRAGGDAFFSKPTDIMNLASKLDLLHGVKPIEPYRILIVEDTTTLANYFAYILQQAGMRTSIVNNPLQIKQPLIEFKPDLILMDLYMPECTGMELANIIRQQDIFAGVPIIYLSSEEDKSKQLLAMGLGGDDFLTKPILPEDLIAVVQRRVQRARVLCSLIVKDSLTGLLNHTAIQEHLQIELGRAARQKTPLSFAMIDLDQFKSVNDTYGHQVGDLVLTSLCRLFIKRLRRSDIAGRYGGEEFALILPDTDIQNAIKVCNEIRENFSQLSLMSHGKNFNVTFSCGVANYPTYPDAASITGAADAALYEAKKTGRNKVVKANN